MKSQTLIIDCRFDYEYKGGHIKEAINIDNPIELVNFLYNHYDLFSIQFISFVKQLHEHLLQYSNKPKHIDYR
jgi:predicted sulfurtransferase